MRYQTIRDLDEAGLELRALCLECGRIGEISSGVWRHLEENGRSMDLVDGRKNFPCKICRSAAHVLLVPASAELVKMTTWANQVAGFFHASRSAKKKGLELRSVKSTGKYLLKRKADPPG